MYIYGEEEIRHADETAAKNGLSINALMENSGKGLYEKISREISKDASILILSGKGNNGGDGIVLARYLLQNGYRTDLVFPFGTPESQAALEHFRYYQSLGFPFQTTLNPAKPYNVIIDSLLGIGITLPLKEEYVEVLGWCNQLNAFRIAVDIPTGVMADQGYCDQAFHADLTYCLHGFKPSAFLLPSAKYYGKKEMIDIGLPQTADWKIWTAEDVRKTLSKRTPFVHKGTFGTGLLIAGSDDMPGSVLLAGLGAMRSGIGKLVIGTTSYAASIIANRLPEATYWFDGLQKCAEGQMPKGIRAVAIGPGINSPYLVEEAVNQLWEREIPIVLDAGALTSRTYSKRKAPVIVTPHPGEFSRMTGKTVEEIQADRLQSASEYAKENQVIVVLKGADTVIAFPDGEGVINSTGNDGLAKGGSGDTLTGMILALICTEKDVKSAVANAVYLHGLCADNYRKIHDSRSLVAGDITDQLGTVLKSLLE